MWFKEKYIDYSSRTESLEINPHFYSQLIFDNSAKTIQWKKEVFSTKDAAYPHAK